MRLLTFLKCVCKQTIYLINHIVISNKIYSKHKISVGIINGIFFVNANRNGENVVEVDLGSIIFGQIELVQLRVTPVVIVIFCKINHF